MTKVEEINCNKTWRNVDERGRGVREGGEDEEQEKGRWRPGAHVSVAPVIRLNNA